MIKTGTLFMGLLALCSAPALAAPAHDVSFPRCEGSDAETIASSVKRDYQQNRIPRWADDQRILGQADPVAWVNPKEVRGEDDTWQVPLTVRGKNTDIQYRVTIDCRKGTARYQH